MKVILKTDIPSLGNSGDIKEVKNGYARNYLIPKGLVLVADAKSKKQQVFLEQIRKNKAAKREKVAHELADKVKGAEVRITVKMGDEGKMFGSITNMQIQAELEKLGYNIERRSILLDENIKNLGVYDVTLKLYENVHPKIKLFVQDETGSTTPVKTKVEEPAEPVKEAEDASAPEEVAQEAEPEAENTAEETPDAESAETTAE